MSKRRRDARRAQRNQAQGGDASGMSNKQMRKLQNQIQTDEVEGVIEVIVRTETEEIVLHQPEVTIMNMGQEMWNIVPQRVEKRPLNIDTTSPIAPEDVEINSDDVKLIMSTANVSEDEAINALKNSGGDLAAAMTNLR